MNAANDAGRLMHVEIAYADGEVDSHVGRWADSVDAVMTAQEVMGDRPGKVTVRAVIGAGQWDAERLTNSAIARARAA